MSKMVVLPKITLYIGWLVCVLVIPVGHENEKGLAPVLLQVQVFCYMQIQPPSWHSVLRAGGKAAFRQRSDVTYHDLRHRCWHGRLRSGPCHPPLRQAGCQAPHQQRRAGRVNKHPLPCTKARQGVFVLGLFRGHRAGERLPLFRG